jgi:hypothetical protein
VSADGGEASELVPMRGLARGVPATTSGRVVVPAQATGPRSLIQRWVGKREQHAAGVSGRGGQPRRAARKRRSPTTAQNALCWRLSCRCDDFAGVVT